MLCSTQQSDVHEQIVGGASALEYLLLATIALVELAEWVYLLLDQTCFEQAKPGICEVVRKAQLLVQIVVHLQEIDLDSRANHSICRCAIECMLLHLHVKKHSDPDKRPSVRISKITWGSFFLINTLLPHPRWS